MDSIKTWLGSAPGIDGNGYRLDETEAARGKFSICCKVKVKRKEKVGQEKRFILKRSVVGEMEPRGGAKWVRDIKSLAAEFQFYEEYWKANSSSSSIPKLVASFSTFETEKDDPEKLFAKNGSEYKPRDDLVFALLLEDLEKEDYGHEYTQLTHGLSIDQLSQFVDCLAGFHAETAKVAQDISKNKENMNIWNLGGFWTKDKRQSFNTEVAGISGRWEAFYGVWAGDILDSVETDQFGIIRTLVEKLNREEDDVKDVVKKVLPSLGLELSKHCHVLSEVVDSEDRVSIVHGDNKVANIFYSPEADQKFKWIDFQWAGLGSPTLDLVYIIAGSVQDVEHLEPKLEGFLRSYWEQFDKLVKPDPSLEVSKDIYDKRLTNFKFGFLDYCRVVLGYMWDGKLNPQVIKSREGGINFCLHNRSVKHVCWITQKIIQYLIELQFYTGGIK